VLDRSNPFVVDLRPLGRRPGNHESLTAALPAPADLAVEMARVVPGSDLEVDLTLSSALDGVLVTGTVTADMSGECARCLEPWEDELTVEVTELFLYEPDPEADAELDAPRYVDGDRLDIEPVIRDALVLALPLAPLCSDDCAGLCSECGARLADVDADHSHGTMDPRWARLADALTPDEES
jgi:uncharacterized protein